MTVIYMPNVELKCFQQKCISHLFLIKCYDDIRFYSKSGIFTLRDNKICKHIYTPKNIETLQFDDVVLYKDPSCLSYKEIFSQLPNDCHVITFKKYIYSASKNDGITYVVICKDDIIYDCYLDVSNGLDSDAIKISVLSFLSL